MKFWTEGDLMQAVFQVDDHAEFWNVTIVLSEEKNPPPA